MCKRLRLVATVDVGGGSIYSKVLIMVVAWFVDVKVLQWLAYDGRGWRDGGSDGLSPGLHKRH